MQLVDRLLYAKVLVELGELAEAEAEVDDLLDARPDDLDALSLLAKIKHIRGELSAAVGCWAQLHAHSPYGEHARLHLMSMLHLAQDPERGAGEFVAAGQGQLVRKPVAYLALEEAFRLFTSRRPGEARKHCQRVAQRYRRRDPSVYKLAVLADAWISELSGELQTACTTLEQLGRERGFETDFDRIVALASLYERLGTEQSLRSAVNICRYLEREMDPLPVLGRLAMLYRRLGRHELAAEYAARHLRAFRRGMHRVEMHQVVHIAAQCYLPIDRLQTIAADSAVLPDPLSERERWVAAALEGNYDDALEGFESGQDNLDRKYRAELHAARGELDTAVDLFIEAFRTDPEDARVLGWLLDTERSRGSEAIRDVLQNDATFAARAHELLERAVQLDPSSPVLWHRMSTLLSSGTEGEQKARQARERATALEEVHDQHRSPVGRVLSAAVYHFLGQSKGLIHEVWVERHPTRPGMGGNLPAENVLGNVTPDMRTNVLNVFLAVREFARTRFPHLTGDIRDFDYTYKVTKEDEPSGGSSAGLPTALAFLSVFLQRSVRQDVASSGEIVTDAHDVLVVQNVGDVEHKVRGAYHRNLSTLLLPTGNRHELEQSSLVPRVITEEIVRFIGRLDEALPLAFADASFG